MKESLITSFNNIIPYVPSMIGNEFRFHTYPSSEYVLGNASDIKQDAEKKIVLIRSFGSAYRCSAQLKPDQNMEETMEKKGMSYEMKLKSTLEKCLNSQEDDILILDPQAESQIKQNEKSTDNVLYDADGSP